jgi:spore coat polysaccharide biosynthesis protein SpsF (cytidylyltransferase family)
MAVFAVPKNNVSTTVGPTGYVAGSGSLTLVPGGGSAFPALSAGQFARVTVIRAAFAQVPSAGSDTYTVFKVTGVAGDVLTIGGTLEGTLDRGYTAGDIVEMRITAGTIDDVQVALGTPFGASGSGHAPGIVPDPGSTAGQAAYLREDATFRNPLQDAALIGVPTAPTAIGGTNTTQVATCAFVLANVGGGAVSSVFTRTGAIVAQAGDYTVAQVTGAAPLANPSFTGVPTAPTATLGTNTTQVATTAFVLANAGAGAVSSVFTRTGAVTAATGDYTVAQVTGAAPLASPALTGGPTAPTPATADNSTKIATTAYVQAQGYLTGNAVASVFTRTGAVTAASGDYTVAQVTGAAPAASPTFTGTVTTAAVAIGDGSNIALGTTTGTRIGTAANQKLSFFNAIPTTQPSGSVLTALSNLGLVASPALAESDITNLVSDLAAKAPLASPTFTGTPAAPTPATADSSTKLATTAYVQAQGYLTSSAVSSVFTRTGVVVAQTGDYTVAQVTGAAPTASPTFSGTVTTAAVAIGDGSNVALGGTTGTKIGTATTQKLGFYNATPIAQPSGSVPTALSNLGLVASPTLAESDITNLTADLAAKAPLASPALTGVPTAPTAGGGTNTTQVATCAFVLANVGGGAVSSVFTRTGAIVAATGDYTVAQVTGAAPLASPALTGVPTAPTATGGTNTTQIATCAFVLANVGGGAVSSVFTRTGAVVAQTGDYAVAQVTGAAPLASPTFTGTVTLPAVTHTDATNETFGTTTGTKFGTATNQKIGFYNATPIVQPSGAALTALSNLGLIASPTLTESDITNLVADLAAKAPILSPTFTGTVTLPAVIHTDATNIAFGTTTGTKIGTATNQKIAFYNATPIVQPSGNISIALSNLGLIASPTIAEGDVTNLTADLLAKAPLASPTFTGTVTLPAVTIGDGSNVALGTTTGTKVGTATTQKLGFYNATPIVKPTGDALAALSNLGLVSSPTLANLFDFMSTSVNSPNSITTTANLVYGTINVCSGTSAYNIKLPTPAAGKFLGIRMAPYGSSAGQLNKLVTVIPNASETIDGATSRIMWAGEFALLYTDGTNWFKLFGRSIPMVCQIYQSTETTSVPNSSLTLVPLRAVQVDNTGQMGNTATGTISILRPSNYLAYAILTVGPLTSGTGTTSLYIVATSTNFAAPIFYLTPTINGGYGVSSTTINMYLAAGEVVDSRSMQINSGAVSLPTYGTSFAVNGLSVVEIPSW